MNTVHLIGAEDVRSAGNSMRQAADDMRRAASQMSDAFESHQRFLTNWLQDIQSVMEKKDEKHSPL